MKLKVKKLDIIIVAVVLCIAALCLLCLNICFDKGSVAVVQVDGSEIAQLPLDEDSTFDVVIDGDTTNTIVIKDGYASVEYANCPDKICKKHNKINRSGESIVCLPNKVVVTIENGEDTQIDGVAK